MNIVIVLTSRCNAACTHCSSSCGPEESQALSLGEIRRLMDDAVALAAGEPVLFALTGGEPFLDLPHLLQVLEHARALGAEATCVTNAYWATSAERAREVLARVQQAGLNVLAISTSVFHERFVRRERVERALGAARDLGLDCTVKYIRPRSDPRSPSEVDDWARRAGATGVQDIGLLPYLRSGAALPASEFVSRPGVPEGRCPGAAFTVREDGVALGCCTPGAETDFFALGSLRKDSLASLTSRFEHSGKYRILREHGPAWLARRAMERGLGDRLRPSYSSVCDLCAHIGSDPLLAAEANAAGEELEIRHMETLLSSLAVG